jgi:hypothetical protein
MTPLFLTLLFRLSAIVTFFFDLECRRDPYEAAKQDLSAKPPK